MDSAALPTSAEEVVRGITGSSTHYTEAGFASVENASDSVNSELTPDVAALEAAIEAAADADLRIYLVRQDAEAAAMIDEARAAGDALYAAKLKEIADAEADAAAALGSDTTAASSALIEGVLHDFLPNSQAPLSNMSLSSLVASKEPSASEAVLAEGCPEPWESNPKFSPCRKFMAEFCTLHGTDPRSRCCLLAVAFSCVMFCCSGIFHYEG